MGPNSPRAAMNLLTHVKSLFEPVLQELAPDPAKVPELLGMIRPAQDPDLWDYQANFAMALAKLRGEKAADVGKRLTIPSNEVTGPAFVSGNNPNVAFINLRFQDSFLAKAVRQIATGPKLGVEPVAKPRTFVIDYSSPNVAKPLHVGHLRSKIIGDALARILEFLGHKVITDNHLGDWGTQFGMIIYGYRN